MTGAELRKRFLDDQASNKKFLAKITERMNFTYDQLLDLHWAIGNINGTNVGNAVELIRRGGLAKQMSDLCDLQLLCRYVSLYAEQLPVLRTEKAQTDKILHATRHDFIRSWNIEGYSFGFISVIADAVSSMSYDLKRDISYCDRASILEKAASELTHRGKRFSQKLLEEHYDAGVSQARYQYSSELQRLIESVEHLQFVVDTFHTHNLHNPLRQSFILLVTIYDATVFDLLRLAFQRDFFRLMAAFAQSNKLDLKNLAQYSSFESLRDSVIEEQLKQRYVKDLLAFCDRQKIFKYDSSLDITFAHYMEMIQRRNLQIHNRGLVDAKYLEMDEAKIYPLILGDVAQIDGDYLAKANLLCERSISELAVWVDGLAAQA